MLILKFMCTRRALKLNSPIFTFMIKQMNTLLVTLVVRRVTWTKN